ncbi:MAG: kelch repeat-containing protein, partial [Ginsengibacter sp.]
MKNIYNRSLYFTFKSRAYLFKVFASLALKSLLLIQTTSVDAQWTRKSDALRKRAECPSVLYKGKIYVFGGFGEEPNLETNNEVYDPALNKWTLIAPFPSGKKISHQAVVVVDDKIWHIGGRAVDAYGPVSSQVIIYDITHNVWMNGPQLKDPSTGQALTIGGGGAALLGRTLHYIGGFAPTICIDQSKYHLTLDVDKWLANPQTTTWENKLAPMPIPRNHLSTVALGGKIYALGGQFQHDCSRADQKYCHVYDPINNTWTRLTDLPAPRSHSEAATFPVDGKIYLAAGQGTSGAAQNTVLVFTPEGNNGLGSWTTATQYKLPNYYIGISAKVIGSKFIMSHGGIKTITDERKETYSASFTRNTPNEFGFLARCFSKTISSGQKAILKNLLYTIEGSKNYSISSNANWVKATKNATGLAIPSGVDIEATIDAAGLSNGSYTATLTANGTGTGTTYARASFCVNLTVGSSGSTGGQKIVSFTLINATTD